MDEQLITLVKDISIPAVIALIIWVVIKPFIPLLRSWIISKLNHGKYYATAEEIDQHISISKKTNVELNDIKTNHIHEISETLKRIEDRLEKMSDNIIFIKSKINGK